MHIENVHIHVASTQTAAAVLRALEDPALTTEPVSARTSPPRIGEAWPGQGGIYAGLARGEDAQPDHHLILATEHGEDLDWEDAKKWASALEAEGHKDFALPTRNESALLYAHLRDQVDASHWHWTGTQYSANRAWYQYFDYGGQYDGGKEAEGWARAVRRLTV